MSVYRKLIIFMIFLSLLSITIFKICHTYNYRFNQGRRLLLDDNLEALSSGEPNATVYRFKNWHHNYYKKIGDNSVRTDSTVGSYLDIHLSEEECHRLGYCWDFKHSHEAKKCNEDLDSKKLCKKQK